MTDSNVAVLWLLFVFNMKYSTSSAALRWWSINQSIIYLTQARSP